MNLSLVIFLLLLVIPYFSFKNLAYGRPSSGEDVTLGFMGDSNALFQISLVSQNQKSHDSKGPGVAETISDLKLYLNITQKPCMW